MAEGYTEADVDRMLRNWGRAARIACGEGRVGTAEFDQRWARYRERIVRGGLPHAPIDDEVDHHISGAFDLLEAEAEAEAEAPAAAQRPTRRWASRVVMAVASVVVGTLVGLSLLSAGGPAPSVATEERLDFTTARPPIVVTTLPPVTSPGAHASGGSPVGGGAASGAGGAPAAALAPPAGGAPGAATAPSPTATPDLSAPPTTTVTSGEEPEVQAPVVAGPDVEAAARLEFGADFAGVANNMIFVRYVGEGVAQTRFQGLPVLRVRWSLDDLEDAVDDFWARIAPAMRTQKIDVSNPGISVVDNAVLVHVEALTPEKQAKVEAAFGDGPYRIR